MLMSSQDYRESLRAFNPTVFVRGQRVESVADEPLLAAGVNAVGVTYDYARSPTRRPTTYCINWNTPVSFARRPVVRCAI